MMLRRVAHSLPVCLWILRTAGMLVPGQKRTEWLAEWQAELWHVWQFCNATSQASLHSEDEVIAFCLGAFKDAFWLRRNHPYAISRPLFRRGDPTRCVLWLTTCAVVSLLLCFCLPGVRRAILSPYRNANNLVLISRQGYSTSQFPTIQLDDYESWKTSTRHLFTGLAFYQPIRKRVHFARHQTADLFIARASSNFFEVLDMPLSVAAADRCSQAGIPQLILSRSTLRRIFHSNAPMVGRTVEIAGQKVRIVAIVPEDFWQLPGQIDAWMLEDEQHLDMLPSNSRGFVLARLKTPARSAGRYSMTVPRDENGGDRYDCVSLAQQALQPFLIFLFALLLACLSLPATTPLPLGEYPLAGDQLSSAIRFRRWLFLATKILLIVPLVFFTSLDLAYAGLRLDSSSAQCIQLVSSFCGFLFAFRWALQDQRRRCPVCLRLLTNPARVGQASRNFLAWNGTELICAVGHGLLHIPEIPTSWFSTQRWLYLDPSWSSLFSDTYLASTGMP